MAVSEKIKSDERVSATNVIEKLSEFTKLALGIVDESSMSVVMAKGAYSNALISVHSK